MQFPQIHPEDLRKKHAEQLAGIVIKNLKDRRINGQYIPSKSDVTKIVLNMIPDGATVSQGGSMTLEETGIRQALLSEKRFRFIDPYEADLSPEESMKRRAKCLTTDVFICSTNALTRDGILVNRDGIGNRVSAMIFGPAKVIIVAGINKIVDDVESGILRIDTVATPMNARRLNRETPCIHTLECSDCRSEHRICAATSIIEMQMNPDRMHVILVGTALGF